MDDTRDTGEPVLVGDAAEAEVLDAGAAFVESEADESCRGDGQRPQRCASGTDDWFETGSSVRHPDQDDSTHMTGPSPPDREPPAEWPLAACIVTCGSDDEPAHAVTDQVDLAHEHGPRRQEVVEEVREFAPVGRDVATGVVAHREHGRVVVVSEERAVGGRRVVWEAPDRLGRTGRPLDSLPSPAQGLPTECCRAVPICRAARGRVARIRIPCSMRCVITKLTSCTGSTISPVHQRVYA